MEPDEEIEELSARLDAMRLVIGLLLQAVPDPLALATQLMLAEKTMRQQNVHAATLEEISVWRETLDDL